MVRKNKVTIQRKKRSTTTAIISSVNKKTVLSGILTLVLIHVRNMVVT